MTDQFSWPSEDAPARRPAPARPGESVVTPPGFTSASWPQRSADPREDGDLLRQRVEQSLGASYLLAEELGRGGMAVVYRATERATQRVVALKVLKTDQLQDTESVTRFEREAALTLRLKHAAIVETYGVHTLTPRGLALALEYMPGGTLKARMRQAGALPVGLARRLLVDVAGALAYAHQRGIVHRDLKPDNIFLAADGGSAKLGDFGIARDGANDDLTLTGSAIGTPAYMSPEQIDAAAVDARSDIYSLGLVAWELLSGQAPWAGETLYSIIQRQKTEALPPLSRYRDDVPAGLQRVLDGCLQKAPGDRWQSMGELMAALGYQQERASADVAPPVNADVTVRYTAASAGSPRSDAASNPASAPPPPLQQPRLDPAPAEAVRRQSETTPTAVPSGTPWVPVATAMGGVLLVLAFVVSRSNQTSTAPRADSTAAAAAEIAIPISDIAAPAAPPTLDDTLKRDSTAMAIPVPAAEAPAEAVPAQPAERPVDPSVLEEVTRLLDAGDYVAAGALARDRLPRRTYLAKRAEIVRACEGEATVLQRRGESSGDCSVIP